MKSCSKPYAVIGLGFGDEGKGMRVHSLTKSLSNPLVVRYSGGQQAGHTVRPTAEDCHVFSNVGSGFFNGAPTYWSKYCTFDPVGLVGELEVLKKYKAFPPVLYLDRKAPITTPYEKHHNRKSKENVEHGTCGLGVGATYEREEKFFSLQVGDLEFPSIFKQKLKLIKEYYKGIRDWSTLESIEMTPHNNQFAECCQILMEQKDNNIFFVDEMPDNFDNIVFEGSQGLMLDQNIGFFPHVTRSNVGSKNILEMSHEPYIYLMTRAFQTRHGNGPMTNTKFPSKVMENPYETNVNNKYQGEFKTSMLDLDLLRYAIQKDDYIRETENRELVITCMDLMVDFSYTSEGKVHHCKNEDHFAERVASELGVRKFRTVSSPWGEGKNLR